MLKLDFTQAADRLIGRIRAVQEMDVVLREVGTTLLAVTKNRIFNEGRNSFGGPIGTYSEAYMPTRRKYNWGPDKKVILTLTSQMRSDYTLIGVGHLHYGLGFHNMHNLSKMRKNEARYRAPIAALTKDEVDLAFNIVNNRVNALLHGKS